MSGAKNDTDPAFMAVLFVAIIVVVGWAVWHFYHAELLEALRYVRIVEMAPISLFGTQQHACLRWIIHAPVGTLPPDADTYKWANGCFGAERLAALTSQQALSYYNITPYSMGFINDMVATYMRWPIVLILFGFGCFAMFFTKRNKFKVRHNLESFIKTQAQTFPFIAPIIDFNPIKHSARAMGQMVPDKLPVFAEALTPEEWLSFHRIPVVSGIPDREMARRAFMIQLGPRWTGIEGWAPYKIGLFAAFALKGVQRREESDDLLGRLSLCWTFKTGFVMPPKLLAEVTKLAHDPEVGGKAVEVASKHAFRTTALIGVLKWARFAGGVLAPGQFVWLRAVDRDLWYPLNNLGRRSFHSEGAGAMAHFMAEESAKKPLPIPRVETAIVTLNTYLANASGSLGQGVIPQREEPKLKLENKTKLA